MPAVYAITQMSGCIVMSHCIYHMPRDMTSIDTDGMLAAAGLLEMTQQIEASEAKRTMSPAPSPPLPLTASKPRGRHKKLAATTSPLSSLQPSPPTTAKASSALGGTSGGGLMCDHNRKRIYCKDCGGSQICPHHKYKTHCKDCGGRDFW